MEYTKRIDRQAKKFIDKQDKLQRKRIYEAIKQLPKGDVKKLQRYAELYRLRVGTYRIIFHWIENEIVIDIIDANNRGDIYKNY